MEKIIKPIIHNRFDIEVRDSRTNELKQKAVSYNIVLDKFFNYLVNKQKKMAYIHVGTGTGTPTIERTQLFTFLGAKATSVVETGKAYPVSYIRRSIVLSPSDFVGAKITEVGLGASQYATDLVTHSMLKDSEGNQIAIQKTDTDVITIYSTFYLTMSQNDEDYVLPTPANNAIISAVLEDNYLNATLVMGAYNTLQTADELAIKAISSKTNVYMAGDYPNKKWISSVTRWNYNEANGHIISSIGSPTFACWKLPNTDIFPQITLLNMAVGTGDGQKLEFNCPIPKVVENSEFIRVNGVTQTKNVDYTFDYENNSAEYPELFISSDNKNFDISGGYNAGYLGCDFFGWNAVAKNPSRGANGSTPIVLDFRKDVKINRFKFPACFTPNYSGGGSSITLKLEYSTDGVLWNQVLNKSYSSLYTATDNISFETITARYWRFYATASAGVGAAISPNLLLGYTTPGIKFTTPPPNGATIEMDCKIDRPIKNVNWVLDFSFSVQFERG